MSGRVQGVAFRAHTCDAARRAGVAGWVRNLPDGRVEALFEGAPEAVAELVAFCREGPAWADVTGVAVSEETPRDERGFEIRSA